MESEEMKEVIKAATFLDLHCDNKQWRDKVDANCLVMYSTRNCVLGQVYGNYLDAEKAFMANPKGDVAWSSVSDTFCSSVDEWKEYLSAFKPGAEWTARGSRNKSTIRGTVVMSDGLNVAYDSSGHNSGMVMPVEGFHRYYTFNSEPKYEIGRVYISNDGRSTFLCRSNDPTDVAGFIRMNSTVGGGNPGHGSAGYYERQYGPLKAWEHQGQSMTATMDVK